MTLDSADEVVGKLDWDWWSKFGDDVVAELTSAFEIAMVEQGGPEMRTTAHARALTYAQQRAAELIKDPASGLNISQSSQEQLRRIIAGGLENGDGLDTIARQIRDAGPFSAARARNIARTETATAIGAGERSAALDSGEEEKSWLTSGGDRVCDICETNDADGWIGINDAFSDGSDTIPAHPGCLVGETLVAAVGVEASTARWYEGDVIILRTAGGHELTATPNHPILTPRGWVAAGQLETGNEVISGRWLQRVASVDEHDHEMPARIEDVAHAVGIALRGAAASVPVTAEDFHGDGLSSQVAVVRTNRELRNRVDASSRQQHGEVALRHAAIEPDPLDSQRPRHSLAGGSHAAAGRCVRCGRLVAPFLRRHARNAEDAGLAGSPRGDAMSKQEPADGTPADVVPSSHELLRIASEVFADELLDVRRVPFCGHVFNLQTAQSFYLANGIFAHNCECDVIYRTKALDYVDPSSGLAGDVGDAIDDSQESARAVATKARILITARCPWDNKLLNARPTPKGTKLFCRRCKQKGRPSFVFPVGPLME